MCHIGVSMGECNGDQGLMPYTANLERSILATLAGIQISKFLDTLFRGYDESKLKNKETKGLRKNIFTFSHPIFRPSSVAPQSKQANLI